MGDQEEEDRRHRLFLMSVFCINMASVCMCVCVKERESVCV